MFCSNCGKEVDNQAVVCPYCGVMTEKGKSFSEKPEKQGNGMAIAGFVCSFLVPILGWVFGGIGLSRANKQDGKGKGFSIAALAISTVMFFVYMSGY